MKSPIVIWNNREFPLVQAARVPASCSLAASSAEGNGIVIDSFNAKEHGRFNNCFPSVTVMPSFERLTPRSTARGSFRLMIGAAEARSSANSTGNSTTVASAGTASCAGYSTFLPFSSILLPLAVRTISRNARYSTTKSSVPSTSASIRSETCSTLSVAIARTSPGMPTNRTPRNTSAGLV